MKNHSNLKNVFLLLTLSAFVLGVELAVACTGWIYMPEFKKCVKQYCSLRNFDQAKEWCEKQNARLIIPCDRKYSNLISILGALEPDRTFSWVGFRRDHKLSKMRNKHILAPVYGNECTMDDLSWLRGEPNYYGQKEDCVHYWHPSGGHPSSFNDISCWNSYWFACEKLQGCDTI